MLLGKTISPPLPWPPAENDDGPKELFKLALGWLKEDKVTRKEREKVTGRIRGPKAEVSLFFFSRVVDLLSRYLAFHPSRRLNFGPGPFVGTCPVYLLDPSGKLANGRQPTQRPSLRNTITLIKPRCPPHRLKNLELELKIIKR